MCFFNVPADHRHFANGGAIFQHQGRHDAARVDRAVGVGMLLAFAKIDRDESNRQSLFGEEYEHAPRIGRGLGVMEFHRASSSDRNAETCRTNRLGYWYCEP